MARRSRKTFEGEMTEGPLVRPRARREAPALDKRVERFVQRYIDSALKLDILRPLAQRPNRFYTLEELALLTEGNPSDLERAIFSMRHLGLVATKQRQNGLLVALSYSPVVRDMAIKLLRYTSNPEGRTAIGRLARGRR